MVGGIFMSNDKYQELEENLKLRNKLLKIGIGCPIIGSTGPTGPTGQSQFLQMKVCFY